MARFRIELDLAALDDLAGEYANATMRITSRQGIQLHGVLKHDLKATIAGINHCLLTTLGACGDVERNVMATPAPITSPLHRQLQETAARLAAHFAPRTSAYHEIWLNGQEVSGAGAPFFFLLPSAFGFFFSLLLLI